MAEDTYFEYSQALGVRNVPRKGSGELGSFQDSYLFDVDFNYSDSPERSNKEHAVREEGTTCTLEDGSLACSHSGSSGFVLLRFDSFDQPFAFGESAGAEGETGFPVNEGDLLIVASNRASLQPREILDVIARTTMGKGRKTSPRELAAAVATKAANKGNEVTVLAAWITQSI